MDQRPSRPTRELGTSITGSVVAPSHIGCPHAFRTRSGYTNIRGETSPITNLRPPRRRDDPRCGWLLWAGGGPKRKRRSGGRDGDTAEVGEKDRLGPPASTADKRPLVQAA
jgi:hypothetical protein